MMKSITKAFRMLAVIIAILHVENTETQEMKLLVELQGAEYGC